MTVLLVILDGYGLREATRDNAITAARRPVFDRLMQTSQFTQLDASGPAVGLPEGQMGNSEVGHLNLGAGRIVYQDVTRIDKAIEDGSLDKNEVIAAAMERVALEGKAVHLFGLVSDGKVHSSLDHLRALVEMAARKKVKDVYLHAFLDGRDTPPTSGRNYVRKVQKFLKEIGIGKIATVGGRYYGMDRDRRWDRTDRAYRAIVYGQADIVSNPLTAIEASYAAGVTDEFMIPVIVNNGNLEAGRLKDRDAAIMFNFRADRMRQLSYFLCGHDIRGYVHPDHPKVELITMTNFDTKMYEAKVAFHPTRLSNLLGEQLARHNMKQLRIAETEKYAHVTFFFNGGMEEPFAGEDRDMIASPKVATYDLQPEMSAAEVTDTAVHRIRSGEYEFVLLNYANCDMIGHTGIFEAARSAVETVDNCLGKLLGAIDEQKGVAIVTADHGNAEMMIDPATGGPWTAHTTNPVPCLLFDPHGVVQKRGEGSISLRDGGILADIAPTVLDILNLDIPYEMTGKSLIVSG